MKPCILLTICAFLIGNIESRKRGVYSSSFVFLTASNPETKKEVRICANYLQYQIKSIPTTAEKAKPLTLKWWDNKVNNTYVCNHGDSTESYNGSVVPLNYRIDSGSSGNPSCISRFTNSSQAFRNATQYMLDQLKDHQASSALLILDKGKQFVTNWRDFLFSDFTDPYANASQAIPTFFIYRSDFWKKLMNLSPDLMNPSLELRFHRPASSTWDASMIIIWLLAVGAVTGGGVWAYHRHNNGKDLNRTVASHRIEEEEDNSFCTRHANTFAILILMIVLISILMLGYFFRPVLIVIFNIFLVILGSFAVYGCANALLSNFTCGRPSCCVTPLCSRFPEMGCISHRPSLGALILYTISLSLCIIWFIFRNTPYAWILLDFINFTLCLHILKSLRLPSLKWITALMLCMFVYDAFMVFITPYITSSGCSVMLEVATGLDCSASQGTGYPTPPIDANLPEKFPMLMQVMHFDPMLECVDVEVEKGYQMTILGLGDIIIPGYLVSHCFTMGGFDSRTRLIYGVICSLGYGIGLVLTFFALTAMGIAQPALIYLVPATLLPVAVTALLRKEMRTIWHGVAHTADSTASVQYIVDQTPTSFENPSQCLSDIESNKTGEDAVLNKPSDEPSETA